MKYDYLVVGAGLYGAVFANEMKKAGKTVAVAEKRRHLAGNIYTSEKHGIQVHEYGAHIFHTSDQAVWDYVNQFAEFNHYINSPMAIYKDEIYNMPFNMNTFSKMWGIKTPKEAEDRIAEQIKGANIKEPKNLEEQAISLVGNDVYEKLIKGYTEKQWGRDCKTLPAFIIRRLPLRFTYNNNYFNDKYQGIPIGGYTRIVEKLLDGVEVTLGVSCQEYRKKTNHTFRKILYTGMIDEYFDYCFGELEYRSLKFEKEEWLNCDNYQGNAVVNYTEREVPYTRIIEHKHFEFGEGKGTIITKEYPVLWKRGDEPYYAINDEKNSILYDKYRKKAENDQNVIFGGRLGHYKYYDMDQVIAEALKLSDIEKAL